VRAIVGGAVLTGFMTANDFTPRGLDRLHRVLSGYVQRGTVPGLVAAVAKGDSTHVEVLGRRDVDRGEAMSRDSIFRIASMSKPVTALSKPVTAVAALMLVEDCVLRLDDPVQEFLPELADRRVLKRPDGPLEETVPAERPITLRDLLTFRAGFAPYGIRIGRSRRPSRQRASRSHRRACPRSRHPSPTFICAGSASCRCSTSPVRHGSTTCRRRSPAC
jgi:CubicO group peptidase (beta-lactamase class C family)